MLDLQDKTMKPLSVQEFLGELPTINSTDILAKNLSHQERLLEAIQKAADKAQPDRSQQGPVFQLGEVIEIKGAKFELIGIGKKTLRLKVA